MIILTGKSASGKTTIASNLIKKYGFEKFITHTTRLPRDKEVNHIDYHFDTIESFLEKKSKNDFIETVEYSGNYYGSAKEDCANNKVLIVDVNGANHFSEYLGNNSLFVYVDCDDVEVTKRMKNRGDSQEDIAKRIKSDKIVFGKNLMKRIDCVIDTTNCSIDDATNKIYELYNDYLKQNKLEEK